MEIDFFIILTRLKATRVNSIILKDLVTTVKKALFIFIKFLFSCN